jgi:hypothetical protein
LPVAAQDIIDIAHLLPGTAVTLVVMCTAAMIVTEFFIGPAP